MVKPETKEFVNNFINKFYDLYGYKPFVFYGVQKTKLKVFDFEKIEKVANTLLKAILDDKKLPYYPITNRKRQRDVINVKHSVMKIMYEMGYTVMAIGKLLNVSHSTVSVGIAKINSFVEINDQVILSIISNIKYELEKQIKPDDNVQSDSGGKINT